MKGGFESDNENVAELNTQQAQTIYHKSKILLKNKEMIFESHKRNAKLLR